jgi:hypothetical protein
MQRFQPEEFISLTRSIANTSMLLQIVDDRERQLLFLTQIRDDLTRLSAACVTAKLPMAVKSIGRVLTLVQLQLTGARIDGQTLERASQSIATLLEDELSTRACFFMNSDDAELWSRNKPWDDDISDKFPSTDFELEEYAKCFAVGRYTASVFHLMRLLEIGLSALAESIGADPANRNWEQILQGIKKKLDENSGLKPPDWKKTEQRYSEISAHFRNLKNAWRNYVMHVHEKYDRERAEEIFVHVRAVMRMLAAQC